MAARPRHGFTLIELLVVLAIISLVSVAVLKVLLPAYASHQLTSAASGIQAAIHQAKDKAMGSGNFAGFRLIPDPNFPIVMQAPPNQNLIDFTAPIAYSRWEPLETPPSYSNGLVSCFPASVPALGQPSAVLILEQSMKDGQNPPQLAEPTSWWWTIRIGERVSIGSGREYTVVGPQVTQTPENFVNTGPPGTVSTLNRGDGPAEYLFLVNGVDDDGDGYIDNGYNGIPPTMMPNAYEAETWQIGLQNGIVAAHYSIARRPAPASNGAGYALPGGYVVDLARSKLSPDPTTGSIDVIVDASGKLVQVQQYSNPASIGVSGNWLIFWVCSNAEVGISPVPDGSFPVTGESLMVGANGRSGRVSILDPNGMAWPYVAIMQGQ